MILTVKMSIEKRNGKDYPIIEDITAKSNVLHSEVDFQYQNSTKFMSDIMNRVVNTNWKICKGAIDPSLEKFLADFIKQIATPMFDNVALQDFIDMEESC